MEYVIVDYPTERTAYIDGEENGLTGTVLRVDSGTHIFDLGAPADYEPESQERIVEGTTVLEPLRVPFAKKASG